MVALTDYLSSPSYDPGMVHTWNQFVEQYLKDYDPFAACLRIDYSMETALEAAKEFMNEPYVRRRITMLEEMRLKHIPKTEPLDKEEREAKEAEFESIDFTPHTPELDQQRIISALMREAHNTGPGSSHAARVTALGQLMKIYNMDKSDDKDTTINNNGGVMIVPAVGSVDDWEAQASGQQAELKKTVRD